MYAFGLGVIKDDKEAVKWYRKAAEQGDASSQYLLGWMYSNGRGVIKDDIPPGSEVSLTQKLVVKKRKDLTD